MDAYKRLMIRLRVAFSLLGTFGGVKCHILDAEQTVEYLADGRSLIRFGDGEFGIYRHKDIHYQKWSPALKADFDKIKHDYEKQAEDCRYVLAVPQKFMTVPSYVLMKKRVYMSSWAESRWQFQRQFNREITYGDAFLFEKVNREIYSRIWNAPNAKSKVVFVHRLDKFAQIFQDTYQKETCFVRCPEKNAYEAVDRLEQDILVAIAERKWTAADTCITISAGPAGKVLAYRLSETGYQCIDTGHCWDDPLEGV